MYCGPVIVRRSSHQVARCRAIYRGRVYAPMLHANRAISAPTVRRPFARELDPADKQHTSVTHIDFVSPATETIPLDVFLSPLQTYFEYRNDFICGGKQRKEDCLAVTVRQGQCFTGKYLVQQSRALPAMYSALPTKNADGTDGCGTPSRQSPSFCRNRFRQNSGKSTVLDEQCST